MLKPNTFQTLSLIMLLAVVSVVCLSPLQATAQTILFVPADNRPVSLEDVVDTVQAAGVEIITPPAAIIGNRTSRGDADALWSWVFSHASEADAIILSGDSMLYGSLVGSRVHTFTKEQLAPRMANYTKLQQLNSATPVYVFATIMRTPKMSAGGVEPAYYEQYGPAIFQLSALKDKAEVEGLTSDEAKQLEELIAGMPPAVMADWSARRALNYSMDVQMIHFAQDGTFSYLILGRDDCSPYSQSHKESRTLSRVAQDLSESQYVSFPGADQLGMLLVTRAVNQLNGRIPFVKVLYADGVGSHTVATYEDKEVGQTIPRQINAAGGIQLDGVSKPDLVVAVNTPANGKTLEANSPANQGVGYKENSDFARLIGTELTQGQPVAVANIAFSNGADNVFMEDLNREHLLPKLATISGWNTASNTLGYTIGQGMLAVHMTTPAKNRLIAQRLLDDWAYQANIRGTIAATTQWTADDSYFYLNALAPQITSEAQTKLQAFADSHLQDFDTRGLMVSFPWNRMFEIDVEFAK